MANEYDIPIAVITGLEEVRQSSKYNMFSSSEVFRELFYLGHYEAVTWLAKEDKKDYCGTCREYNCDDCRYNKVVVDNKKYIAALHELGQILSLPDILAGGKSV